jgi:hypothetical protein
MSPRSLTRHQHIEGIRCGVVSLLDILNEADWLSSADTAAIAAVTPRSVKPGGNSPRPQPCLRSRCRMFPGPLV